MNSLSTSIDFEEITKTTNSKKKNNNQKPNKTMTFTTNDIPNLSGKVAIVTGANSGIGKISALELARFEESLIVFVCFVVFFFLFFIIIVFWFCFISLLGMEPV